MRGCWGGADDGLGADISDILGDLSPEQDVMLLPGGGKQQAAGDGVPVLPAMPIIESYHQSNSRSARAPHPPPQPPHHLFPTIILLLLLLLPGRLRSPRSHLICGRPWIRD